MHYKKCCAFCAFYFVHFSSVKDECGCIMRKRGVMKCVLTDKTASVYTHSHTHTFSLYMCQQNTSDNALSQGITF